MSIKVGENIEVLFSHTKIEGKSVKDGKEIDVLIPVATECGVIKDGHILASGRSVCHEGDNFSYDVGRKIALKHTLAKTTLPKADKAAIWNAYRNMPASPRW